MLKQSTKNNLAPRWILLAVVQAFGCVIYFVSYTKPSTTLQRPLPARLYTAKHADGGKNKSLANASESEDSKVKKSLLQSSWIKLFPHLSHMVTAIDADNLKVITNAQKTKISFDSGRVFEVGGVFKGEIISHGNNGERKTYGGDFFIATLRRTNSAIDGVSCKVTDNMNGSYGVLCILPWEGKARIEVIMFHPSEGIYKLMKTYSSEKEFGIIMNTTLLNSMNQTEFTSCSIGFPNKSSQELCNYSNPLHGEKRMCVKPPSGECSKIIWQQRGKRLYKFFDDTYFRKNINYFVSIKGSGTEMLVKNTNATNYHYFDQTSENPTSPSGWFFRSKWTSMRVNVGKYELSDLDSCVKNKRLYFFGDSTMRQWYYFVLEYLNLTDYGPDNSIVWSNGRDAQSKTLNLTLQYRSHGPPLHNPGPEECRPYISNSLDLIEEGGNGSIVFITIGYHFCFFDPDVLGSRIRIIKNSVVSLLKRLPGTKVFIKGLYYFPHDSMCPGPWLTDRFEVMLRHEFAGITDVKFIELWDMTVVAKNNILHPYNSFLCRTFRLV